MAKKIYFCHLRKEIGILTEKIDDHYQRYGVYNEHYHEPTELIKKRTKIFEGLLEKSKEKKDNVYYWLIVSKYARFEENYKSWEEKSWQIIKSINKDDFSKWLETYNHKISHNHFGKILKEIERTAVKTMDWQIIHELAKSGSELKERALNEVLRRLIPKEG